LGAVGAGTLPATASQAPESPGLALAVDRNWTLECTDWNLDHNHRQDNKLPLQKPVMDKRERDPRDPQLQTKYDMYGMEYLVGQYQVTCSVCPFLQVRPLMTLQLWNLRGLSVTLAAIVIIVNMGLFQ